MLICIAGKNDIAVETLRYLDTHNDGKYNLCVVCNQTENGKNSWQKSLRKYAEMRKIKEYQLEELYDIEDLILLSLEFDRLVKPAMFKSKALFNIHYSLLPAYKGMYTSAIPILKGERYSGVTLHYIDKGIDTGNIIAQKSFELDSNLTCRDLYFLYTQYAIELMQNNIEKILTNQVISYLQPSSNSTYYSKHYIDYSNLKIDLIQTAEVIRRQVRAFTFREYQMPNIYGHDIIECEITDEKSEEKPGEIIYEDQKKICLATIDYNIVLYFDRFSELMEACKEGNLDIVNDVCNIKKYVHERDSHGWTPLVVATYFNQKEVVNYLLTNGANVNVKNNNGTNILMYAKETFLHYNDIELLCMYLKMGVSAYDKDFEDKDLFNYVKTADIEEVKREKILEAILFSS